MFDYPMKDTILAHVNYFSLVVIWRLRYKDAARYDLANSLYYVVKISSRNLP